MFTVAKYVLGVVRPLKLLYLPTYGRARASRLCVACCALFRFSARILQTKRKRYR